MSLREQTEIVIGGRKYEDSRSLRERWNTTNWMLKKYIEEGMPPPIKVGRKRYFDTEVVDDWLVGK